MRVSFVSDWPAYLFMAVFIGAVLYIVIRRRRKNADSIETSKGKK
jgi:hypothetical protein